jgi:pimeloyl-ACP methyl ester carboxylesterase
LWQYILGIIIFLNGHFHGRKNHHLPNKKIHYRIAGAGNPVVLLHGFGEDGDIWSHQVKFLQSFYQLIIPDLPGTGASELIDDMSIEGMAECIKEIIIRELTYPTEQVCVIGHSMGGYITLALAEKYPQLLNSFGLVHSSAFADSEEKKIARQKSIDFIQTNGAYDFLKTAIPGLFGDIWSPAHQTEITSLVHKRKNFTPTALVQYYRAMIARPERTAVFKNFSGPVLFIIGEHDKAVPFEQSMQQTPLLNLAYIHILRNSAHMGMWEETDKVNAAMLSFLQRAT